MKRVLVVESVCGGGWAEPTIPDSLAREGRLMLETVVKELARSCFDRTQGPPSDAVFPVQISILWDSRLGTPPELPAKIHTIQPPLDFESCLQKILQEQDAALIIAPEIDGALERFTRIVEVSKVVNLGSSLEGVRLAADKWECNQWLNTHGIRAVPTYLVDVTSPDETLEYPIVIKPRFGAGSQSTWLIPTVEEWRTKQEEFGSDPWLKDAVWQPYIPGRTLSMAGIVTSAIELWPLAEQKLDQFRYLGGCILPQDPVTEICKDLVRRTLQIVPGLSGYVGVDLIMNDQPIIVEINPRLTTSILGYAKLARTPVLTSLLAQLRSDRKSETWKYRPVLWGSELLKFRI